MSQISVLTYYLYSSIVYSGVLVHIQCISTVKMTGIMGLSKMDSLPTFYSIIFCKHCQNDSSYLSAQNVQAASVVKMTVFEVLHKMGRLITLQSNFFE
jgi:hypothetical protein